MKFSWFFCPLATTIIKRRVKLGRVLVSTTIHELITEMPNGQGKLLHEKTRKKMSNRRKYCTEAPRQQREWSSPAVFFLRPRKYIWKIFFGMIFL